MAIHLGPRPPEVREAQKRFTNWRRTKRGGEKIPLSLWAAAMKLCRRHSVHRVSRWLRLSDAALRERIEHRAQRRPRRAKFVEYSVPGLPSVGAEYELEREGTGLKIRVRGAAVADVAALAKLLGGEQP
jgi:hypothetical protein